MSLSALDVFKSLDIFGYQAQIHIAKGQRVHKTVCGAVSTLVYVALAAVLLYECGFELLVAELDSSAFHHARRRLASTDEGVKLIK
jgi:hypothetical protein